MAFQKGQSGNPGGRPKLPDKLQSRLRSLTPRAIDAVARALDSDDEKTALQAANFVFDRIYGKPVQAVEQQTNVDVRVLHLEAVKALNAHVVDVTHNAQPLQAIAMQPVQIHQPAIDVEAVPVQPDPLSN